MASDARSARLQAAREEELLRGRPYAVLRAMRSTVTELWSDKAGMFGVLVMLLMFAMAIFAPLIAPYPPDQQSLFDRLQAPSWDHPMGTDQLGRDVLSRVIYGSRVSLEVGLAVVALAGTFGILMGLVAGYRGGRTSSTGLSLPSSRWSISLMPAGPGTGGWSSERSTAPGLIVVYVKRPRCASVW